MYDIVTCDEIWIYLYKLKTKQSTVCMSPENPKQIIVLYSKSASKKNNAALSNKSRYIIAIPLKDLGQSMDFDVPQFVCQKLLQN